MHVPKDLIAWMLHWPCSLEDIQEPRRVLHTQLNAAINV